MKDTQSFKATDILSNMTSSACLADNQNNILPLKKQERNNPSERQQSKLLLRQCLHYTKSPDTLL